MIPKKLIISPKNIFFRNMISQELVSSLKNSIDRHKVHWLTVATRSVRFNALHGWPDERRGTILSFYRYAKKPR